MITSEPLSEFDINKPQHVILKGESSKLTYRYAAFPLIVEWLYINDGKFDSRRQWRKEFILFLKKTLS